jgi:glycolate oxidase
MEVEDLLEQITRLLTSHDVIRISVARSEEDRARLWLGRKAAFPAVGRISPDYYCMDGTIPRRELSAVLTEISRLSEHYELQVANVFHAGDGNLHPLILYDANQDSQMKRAEQFGSDILRLCIARGGTITGEHGVGIEKINEMCLQFNTQELRIFHGVKSAFDEKGILNPGKAIPTLSRCAEFGAMHVHSGQEKFPDLDRF